MYLCYIDESGTPELTGDTSHFVLLGLVTPVWDWKSQDIAVAELKRDFGIASVEIHTGWIMRRYLEQERIQGFTQMDWPQRRAAAQKERDSVLLRTAANKGKRAVQDLIKNYRKTAPYLHLTYAERVKCLERLADLIGSWANVRLLAEGIDKSSFNGTEPATPPREEGFQQIVSRFQKLIESQPDPAAVGLLIHDTADTVSRRLTELTRRFHAHGTMFTKITRIVETPFFVDSQLTVGVQLADLCAYATRRFFENKETNLFDRIYSRFQRQKGRLTGLRHYTGKVPCTCKVCQEPR